jgi:hypothetical protein
VHALEKRLDTSTLLVKEHSFPKMNMIVSTCRAAHDSALKNTLSENQERKRGAAWECG